MKALFLAGITAALIVGPALAHQDDAADQPAKEKKICRSERPTGSYFTKRTCHTRAEWKAIDAVNAGDTQMMRERIEQSNGNGRPQ